jgi:hypothetical protein
MGKKHDAREKIIAAAKRIKAEREAADKKEKKNLKLEKKAKTNSEARRKVHASVPPTREGGNRWRR